MGQVEEFTLAMDGFSQSPRRVWVYLPDSYAHTRKKYDVLYMFDGHNLFFDEVATYGKCWGLKDYLDETDLDLVVIGQDCNHTGNRRLSEYCPDTLVNTDLEDLPRFKARGMETAEWFVNVLKPYCEKNYHISKDRMHVGIGGSSMGGLMSEYMIMKYNRLFSKAACVSPSTHFNYAFLMDLVDQTSFKESRIYLDQGSQEVHGKRLFIDSMDMMLNLSHALNEKGCSTYPHLVPGGHHTEADWEKVVPVFLPYLYPDLYTKKH
jgi:predicted alpha/beta superfamily hydrolase